MLPMDVDAILRAHVPESFSYQKDCYALSLLALAIGGGRPLSVLRCGPFARLLDKAIVKRALANAGRGVLTPECVRRALPERLAEYTITLGRWGPPRSSQGHERYYQMSRPGENVVLQLNFPHEHSRAYERLVRPRDWHPFVLYSHPARDEAPYTLGWARLELDVRAGEVLIEEVQSDWVRAVGSYRERAEEWLALGEPAHLPFNDEMGGTAAEVLNYIEQVLAPHARVWEECVLSAAIELAYERFGTRRVFFHTHEGGRIMKCMYSQRLPPRSLYTELPERFCFTRTRVPPAMHRRDPRVRKGAVEWFVLELP